MMYLLTGTTEEIVKRRVKCTRCRGVCRRCPEFLKVYQRCSVKFNGSGIRVEQSFALGISLKNTSQLGLIILTDAQDNVVRHKFTDLL